LQSWYGADEADDISEEEDDDSSHGYMPPLMGRQYDTDSDEESCGDVPPLMERGNCDESSSSDDDSFIAPTRGWRPKYDDSDDDDSIATDDNKEFELFLDLDMQLHVEDEAGRELAIPTVEFAALKYEGKSAKIGPNTYLADSGASSHMGPGDAGMFDLEDKHATIRVGNGKQLETAKIGKRKGTVIQSDGSEVQIIMKQYKQVPDLWCNLFSLTAALNDGWILSNKSKMITLTKDGVSLTFDKIIPSGDGYLCGVEIVPARETAAAATTLAEGATLDINDFHLIMNHAAEETLHLTAKAHGIKLTGKLKPCFACKTANARKPKISKSTENVASKHGERIFIDISSIKFKSYGGTKYWLLAVDDKSDQSWSFFLPKKSDLADRMMPFLRQMR
jgi:hypothetical protein